MIVKTLASTCLLLGIRWQKERQADKMRTCTHSLPSFLAAHLIFSPCPLRNFLKTNFYGGLRSTPGFLQVADLSAGGVLLPWEELPANGGTCLFGEEGASCSSVFSKLTGSCVDPPTESIGVTPLSMPPEMPQALAFLPQINKHGSNHGHFHWTSSDSPCSYFNWLNFFRILCTLDWTWAQVRRGVNGNASSISNKISCHCCSVKLFMLLARNFSSNKSINNAVESFFQFLLDLGGAGSAMWG